MSQRKNLQVNKMLEKKLYTEYKNLLDNIALIIRVLK